MFLALLFLLASLFFGLVASTRFKVIDSFLKQTFFSITVGLLAGSWLALIISWIAGSLNEYVVLLTSVLLLAAGFALFYKRGIQLKRLALKNDGWPALAFLLLVFAVFFAINFFGVLYPNDKGDLTVTANAWGDYGIHFALINSFAYTNNFPPQYPVLYNQPLGYPFVMDFLSSVLVVGGWTLRDAVIVPNLLYSLAFLVGVFLLAVALFEKTAVGLLAILLFFFNGDLGFVYFVRDAVSSGNVGLFLQNLPRAYSHLPDQGFHFMNLFFSIFLPQRSAIMGFAVSLLVLLLLHKIFEKKAGKQEFLLAGALIGLLPLVHGHSFIVVGVAAGFVFLHALASKAFEWREWIWLIAPAVLLGLPQLAWISQQVSGSFVGLQLGWMAKNSGAGLLELTWFWLKNWGVVLVLGVIGFVLAPKRVKWFAAPFVFLFFLSNVMRFQPQDWDTIKVLVYPFLFACFFAALALSELWEKRKWRPVPQLLVLALLFFGVFSGVLTLAWWAGDHPSLYPQRDVAVAEWVKSNTRADGVWLTGDAHNHVVPSLAGRRILLGYRGWMWTHGLSYGELERDEARMYATADCTLFKKYEVDYVFLGPQENAFNPNPMAFETSPFFDKIFDANLDGYSFKIFEVEC